MATVYRCDFCGAVMQTGDGVSLKTVRDIGLRSEHPVNVDLCPDCWTGMKESLALAGKAVA